MGVKNERAKPTRPKDVEEIIFVKQKCSVAMNSFMSLITHLTHDYGIGFWSVSPPLGGGTAKN